MKSFLYAGDAAGKLLWNLITPVLVYSAQLLGEIADDIVSIDRAMRWGFGWQQGPFEIWDAIGIEKSLQKLEAESRVRDSSLGEGNAGVWSRFLL